MRLRFEGKRVRGARQRASRETQRVPPRRRAGDGTLAVAVLGAGAQALDGPRRGHGLGEIKRELVPFPEPLRTPRALAKPKPREPSFYRLVGVGVGVGVGVVAQERVVYVARARRVALELRGERRARPRGPRVGSLEPVKRARQAQPRGDVVPRSAVQRGERVPHRRRVGTFFFSRRRVIRSSGFRMMRGSTRLFFGAARGERARLQREHARRQAPAVERGGAHGVGVEARLGVRRRRAQRPRGERRVRGRRVLE